MGYIGLQSLVKRSGSDTLQNLIIEFHPPSDPLELLKAFLDLGTAVCFIIVLGVIIVSARKYPLLQRKDLFIPLITFAMLGVISTAMDAYDEWFWFTPGEFYDFVWKPIRLGLLIIAVIILLITFQRFYMISERLFGED